MRSLINSIILIILFQLTFYLIGTVSHGKIKGTDLHNGFSDQMKDDMQELLEIIKGMNEVIKGINSNMPPTSWLNLSLPSFSLFWI